ncbi:hypothetical protein MATL_G00255530 [Megalops atlanticus]|uniref:Ig-like domain-containing protein n=1 Tax=Megalops atlanticus TaxID=7932 RepID=A0A9D3PA08_MEGAT|nr:hypothetical protein MATL_G00255530 [Megalops atlanticus]
MMMSIIYGLFSVLLTVRTNGFSMQGPAAGSTVAQLGGSVLLPCSVDRPLALEEVEVEWRRTDSETLVHLFQEGESRPESQPERYRERATFFNELIPKGNFSLLLTNVSTEDRGVYECVVHSNLESNRISVEIKDVERLVVTGSDQAISVHAGEEVIMNCIVDTHVPLNELQVEWLKTDQDIMVLLFSEGESRPESQHERYQARAQFFPEEIQKGNFSLKLRDVKTEDKGEYMCSVHSDSQSANTTARLLELGFSYLHLSVLVFSISAPFIALLSSVPALVWIIKKDGSKRALFLHGFHVIAPCIMNFCAFILWGMTEGFLAEAFTCSAINLLRILLLFKMAPYLQLIPDNLCIVMIKRKTMHFEVMVINTGICSVFLWEYLTNNSPVGWAKFQIGCGFGFTIILCVMAFISIGTTDAFSFEMLAVSIPVQVLSIAQMKGTIIIEYFVGNALTLFAMAALTFIKPCCMLFKKHLYTCLLVIIFISQITTVFRHLDVTQDKSKEGPGLISVTAYLYTLTAAAGFKHRSDLPAIPHTFLYMFGATGLTVVNSVAVAVELFQKAKTGHQTVEDLQIILLSFESVFVTGWLTLQLFAYCMKKKQKNPCGHWNIIQRGQSQSTASQSSKKPQNHCLHTIMEDHLIQEASVMKQSNSKHPLLLRESQKYQKKSYHI